MPIALLRNDELPAVTCSEDATLPPDENEPMPIARPVDDEAKEEEQLEVNAQALAQRMQHTESQLHQMEQQPPVQATIVAWGEDDDDDTTAHCHRKCPLHPFVSVTVLLAVLATTGISLGLVFGGRPGDDKKSSSLQNPTSSPSSHRCFNTTDELQKRIDQYVEANSSVLSELNQTYGLPMGAWCVSKISDFSCLFSARRNPSMASFNEDIASWNLSSAIRADYMFYGADLFNADVSMWDVSSVTDMSWMFYDADVFNNNLSEWNVSRVTDMSSMFRYADLFNSNVSSWDVSSVTDMSRMFSGAFSFNSDVSTWDVSSVTDMTGMFSGAFSFNSNVAMWDVSSVTDMSRMFYNAVSFNSNVSSWDVSSVTDMSWMFEDAIAFNQDLSSWDVSSVTDMHDMFEGATLFSQNLCAWGSKLSQNTIVTNMFWNTSCPFQIDPNLSAVPPGPFCYSCGI